METVDQIATGIATLCREASFLDAVERYYSPSIVSIEAVDFGLGREQRGIEAIRHKHAFWEQHNETHSVSVRGPYLGTGPAANQFALHFLFDITRKATAVRAPLSEVAVYTVVNGKIAHEEFFYPSA